MKNQLPKNWIETELKEIISYVIGGDWGKDSDSIADEDFVNILCIRGSEIKNWKKDKGNTASQRKIKKSSLLNRQLVKGDILLEISGGGPDQPVGRTVLIDDDVLNYKKDLPKVCTNFLRLVRIHQNIDSRLINHYLQYFYFSGEITKYQGGSNNLRNLKYKDYETISIPLPPLSEQNRIVAKLDTLFAQLETIKTSMEKIPVLLKDFRQQVLTQAVTGKLTEEWRKGKNVEKWKNFTFGELMIGTPKNGAYYSRELYGTGTRIIRIDSFYEGKLKSWDYIQRVKISEKDKAFYKIEIGNILINRVNSIEYLGKCMLVEELPEECIFESNMMRVIINQDMISSKYIRTFLTSALGLKELRKKAKHAVNQASINQQDVKAVEINLPSGKEQIEIVSQVESLFAKADVIEQQYISLKQKIDTLPQALLHKAFKGELTEQLDSDGDARDLLKQIQELKGTTAKVTKNAKLEKLKDFNKKIKKYLKSEDIVGMVAKRK